MESPVVLSRGQQRLLDLTNRYGGRSVVAGITGFSVAASVAATALSVFTTPTPPEMIGPSFVIATAVPLVVAPLCSSAIVRLTSTLALAVGELHRHATTDPLTGIANRRRFFTLVDDRLTNGPPGSAFLLGMADVDDFKLVNDQYGHRAGDEALVALGRRLEEAVGPSGVVARLGGDEFALLVPIGDSVSAPTEAIERAASGVVTRQGVRITASLGLRVVEAGISADDAVHLADVALLQAKAHRRSRAAR